MLEEDDPILNDGSKSEVSVDCQLSQMSQTVFNQIEE